MAVTGLMGQIHVNELSAAGPRINVTCSYLDLWQEKRGLTLCNFYFKMYFAQILHEKYWVFSSEMTSDGSRDCKKHG